MISHETLDRQSLSVSTMETTTSTASDNSNPVVPDESNGAFGHKNDSGIEKVVSTSTIQENESVATTTAHSTIATDVRRMKLIVRSQYWGRILKGKTCRNPTNVHRPYRVISGQAVLYNTDEYWGCCPHHGKRVLEVQECHFTDAAPGQDWDLYLVGSWVSPTHAIHDFFLLPRNQTIIDLNRQATVEGWSYVGPAKAPTIRAELDEMLRNTLEINEQYGYRYHHVHIDIMMDKAYDRETPRTRKMNNEKAREDRKGVSPSQAQVAQESTESVTDDTTSTPERDGPPSIGNFNNHRSHQRKNNPFVNKAAMAPPIPHVISNDSSLFSQSVASTTAMSSYHDAPSWVGTSEAASGYWNMAVLPPMYQSHHHGHPMVGGSIAGPLGANGGGEYLNAAMQWLPGNAVSYQNPPSGFDTAMVTSSHQWHHVSGVPAAVPRLLGHHTSNGNYHPQQSPTHTPSFLNMTDLEQYLLYQEPLVATPVNGTSLHGLSSHQHQYPNAFMPLTASGHSPSYHHKQKHQHQQQRRHHHAPMTVPREILSQPATSASSAVSSTSMLSTSGVSAVMAPPATVSKADVVGCADTTSSGVETSSSTSTATAVNTGNPSPTTAATSPSWTMGRGVGLPPRRSESHSD